MPAAAAACTAVATLGGFAAPAAARPVNKSSSLPNLHRGGGSSFAAGGRGVLARTTTSAEGAFDVRFDPTSPTSPTSPMSPFGGRPSPMMTALMSATFSTDGRGQVWNGRMEAAGHWGVGPPKAGAYKKVVPKGVFKNQHVFEPDPTPATQFRRHFERGDLPITRKFGSIPGVAWKVEPERLDYVYNLPIFFDGLLEKAEPFATMAYAGLQDMLNAARGKEPSLLRPAVPVVIMPIRRALHTRDNGIMCKAINMLQLMVRCDPGCGAVLVPYYRQLLPTFNLYRANNANLGDGIDYAQRKRENMGDLCAETLELMERTGGEDAFINIKYMIPTYESCMS